MLYMRCPYCNNDNNKVVDKRETDNGIVTRRRRECLSCNKRFTTYERIELVNLFILKKDGKRELFDPIKLEKGILRSCMKRPVSHGQVQNIVKEIELMLRNRSKTEIPSKNIGTMVLTRLKKIDKVAYIRFASVYRDFTDIEEFETELKKIMD